LALLVLLFAVTTTFVVIEVRDRIQRLVQEHRERIEAIEEPELLKELERRHDELASRSTVILDLETAEIMDPEATSVDVGPWSEGVTVLDGGVGFDGLLGQLLIGRIELEVVVEDVAGRRTALWQREITAAEISPEGMWLHFSVDLSEVRPGTLRFVKRHVPTLAGRILGTSGPNPLGFVLWRKPALRPAKQEGQPNIVLISLDTLRADHLGIAGYRRDTSPNLDELATQGLWFETAVAQSPWTRPSHYSILTGTNPTKHGVTQPVQRTKGTWVSSVPTLAEVLRDRGYATAAYTGQGSISAEFGFYRGFDFYNESSGKEHECISDAPRVFSQAQRWLADHSDRTFFLFVHTYEPHRPFCDEHFIDQESITGDHSKRTAIARYDGDIRRTDMYLGQLLNTLRSEGLLENTIVVVTSDHGENLGEHDPIGNKSHGHNLYDELLLVPLLFAGGPVRPYAGRVSKQVRSIDIFPTVLELAGFPVPDHVDGLSLLPLAQGQAEQERDAYSGATTYGPQLESVRSRGWKLIRTLGPHAVEGGQPTGPKAQLYDLEADPGERLNLAQRQPKVTAEYADLLDEIVTEPSKLPDRRPQPEADTVVDPQLLEQLRSLGYIE